MESCTCCCCCCCTNRQASIVIGIVAFLVFGAQLCEICQLKAAFTPEEYTAQIVDHSFFLFFAILELIGAVQRKRWLLLPFMIHVGLHALVYFLLMFIPLSILVRGYRSRALQFFIGYFFNSAFSAWILWIVYKYFSELGMIGGSYEPLKDVETGSNSNSTNTASKGSNPKPKHKSKSKSKSRSKDKSAR